ncbi:tetratricopeptide repeat protein [Qipengyuania flava]|uniref:tetratricopeptide repeat protein n=1 Tax=Qipengyuania flava TaxID=192812 RepID=UPI001C62DA2B|nr:tetratricopeptide repeat protein [Qipengyuania flava]QYJ05915.1 tetratricopeptide repeat protein [Qipengyuania flava]
MTCRPDTFLRFIALIAAVALGACAESEQPPTTIESAQAELARGKPIAAEVFLERALEEGAERSAVAAFFGQAQLQEGDMRAAREWLGPGEFSDETRALGFRLLGELEMREGNLAEAGRAFDRSFEANPDSADLWVDIGRLRYRGGEQLQAIEAADRALELDEGNAEALRFRGQLARDAEGMMAGARLLERALASRPDDVGLRVEYAATLGDAGRASDALEVLRANGGEAAQNPRGLFVQAVIAARGGYFPLARTLLTRSELPQQEVAAAQLLSAIIDLQEENFASAAQTLDRLFARQPDNRRVRDLLAYALSRSDGERELVRRFGEFAAGSAGSTYLRTLVARAYETLDDREKAGILLDLAAVGNANLSILPSATPPEALAVSTVESGLETRDYVRSAIAEREASRALGRARAFAERHPGSGDAFAILGDAEYARGNKRAAREAYERSASVRRPWPLTLRLAGTQDDAESATRVLEAYVRENPMNGEAAAILADAYAAEGNWEQANLLLDHAIGHGMGRVPWVLAARSVGALQGDDGETALALALAAHDLQPMNPLAIAALVASLPESEEAARNELRAKAQSLRGN